MSSHFSHQPLLPGSKKNINACRRKHDATPNIVGLIDLLKNNLQDIQKQRLRGRNMMRLPTNSWVDRLTKKQIQDIQNKSPSRASLPSVSNDTVILTVHSLVLSTIDWTKEITCKRITSITPSIMLSRIYTRHISCYKNSSACKQFISMQTA